MSIARTKSQLAFAVLEAQRGQLTLPSSANSLVLAGSLTAGQKPNYTDSPEINNTRGVLARFADGMSAGDFNFKIIPRPKTAGSEPVASALYQSLMGQKTVNAGVSVSYTQSLTKPSFTLAYRKGHMVFYCIGATVTEMTSSVTNKGPVELNFKGKFMQRISLGDDQVALAALALQNQVKVSDAKRFQVGGYVYNPACAANGGLADQNQPSGQGYLITAIDTVTHYLTLADNLDFDWALGEPVQGWLPSQQTLGSPIAARDASLKINGVEGKVQSLDVSIVDLANYIEDEITTAEYPTDYVEGDRKITGSYTSYFRSEDAAKFAQGVSNAEYQLDFVFGTTGSRMTLTLPRIPTEIPEESESGPALLIKQSFTALEQSGEDSASILFD